jgi:arginyl-tRNA--protein-N-Asp/Glu arginylyltransferase
MNQEQRETVDRVMENASRQIWVTFQKEGVHLYPAAGTDPKLQDVSFLSHPHRHIFHFRVYIDVFHNDRDIEFIQFKRWLQGLYDNAVLELNFKSCEMIADDLYLKISEKYPNRNVTIEVSEDNENGCSINYALHKPAMSIKV